MQCVLAAHVTVLNNVRPSVLSAALEPTVTRLREIRTSDAAAIAQERQRKAAERMQSVVIPAAVLASPRANLITAVVQGKVARLSGETATFFGGMMAESIERCRLPASLATRALLSRILMTVMDRSYPPSELLTRICIDVPGVIP